MRRGPLTGWKHRAGRMTGPPYIPGIIGPDPSLRCKQGRVLSTAACMMDTAKTYTHMGVAFPAK